MSLFIRILPNEIDSSYPYNFCFNSLKQSNHQWHPEQYLSCCHCLSLLLVKVCNSEKIDLLLLSCNTSQTVKCVQYHSLDLSHFKHSFPFLVAFILPQLICSCLSISVISFISLPSFVTRHNAPEFQIQVFF